MLKTFSFLLCVAVAVLCSIGISCKKDNPVTPNPPGHKPITFQVTFTSIRWCRLQWTNDSSAASHRYLLIRNNRDTIFNDSLTSHESPFVFQDTVLLPGSSYSYWIYRLVNGVRWDSANVSARTLDTSRDNLSWETIRLGVAGNVLYGVWGTSQNSIWLAGDIWNTDSNRHCLAVHLKNGRFEYPYTDITGEFYGVYGLTDSMIWFSGENHLTEWDGHHFIYHVFDGDSLPYWNATLYAVWVTPDGREVYGVGDGGTVIHRKPDESWETMVSGTTLRLTSIIGFSSREIYASGTNGSTNEGIVLTFDGTAWKEIAHSFYPASSDTTKLVGALMRVGGESGDSLYAVGGFFYKRDRDRWILPNAPCNSLDGPTPCGGFRDVIGGTWNNMWIAGDYGDILHYTGEHWKQLAQFYDLSSDLRLVGLQVFPNDVFIVGSDHTSAVIMHGR